MIGTLVTVEPVAAEAAVAAAGTASSVPRPCPAARLR